MKTNLKARNVRFFVQDGCLVRTVTSDAADGRNYTHRCDLATFEIVAHAVAETPPEGEGTTLTVIVQQEGLPYTRVNLALEFLKERGLIEIRHRRSFPAASETYLDAMVEYHALAEEPKPT